MRIVLIFLVLIFSFNSISIAAVNYVIIENQVDGEYFIAPNGLTPRFTGANKFTKYNTNQDSLGYMGTISGVFSANTYNTGDLWMENSPVSQPFRGNRCRNGNKNCPTNGIWEAKVLKNDGAYRITQTSTAGESANGRPILSDSFYQYLLTLPINTRNIFKINSCSAYAQDYSRDDISCLSLSRKRVKSYDVDVTKVGNLILKSTGALQEIFVDSNGKPALGLGSKFCSIGFDGNGQQGIMCKLVEYEFKGQIHNSLFLKLNINTAMLGVSSIKATEAQFSGDGVKWSRYGAEPRMNTIFTQGNNGVYVFLSNSLLLKIVSSNPDQFVDNTAFTFSFRNSAAPQSGFYEFTPSNYMVIKPRNYGISIIPADFNPNQSKTGKVGSDEPPIEFNYIVTTSGTRQADSITAKVEGPSTTVKGQSYCLFSSDNNQIKVPFSAYLSFKNGDGSNVKYRASCDSNEISLKDALWEETPWDRPDEDLGSFYRTNLDLLFPMNEANSRFALDGSDWLGTVSASGTITVKAIWTGPDIH